MSNVKNVIFGLVLGSIGAIAGIVMATALPTKYAASNYDAQAVVIYGYTSSNVLTPILVDNSGIVQVKTN